MTQKNDNLALWESVATTDPDYTKGYTGGGGFKGTAINATYLVRRATEMWGPLGIGWGYEIIEDRMDEGAPIAHKQGEESVLSDHKHTIHTIKLRLWFKQNDQVGEVVNYGHTPMIYMNKYGLQTEQEPAKKSLTDALKKCLSMLGFSADVFLGDYDDDNYVAQVAAQSKIEKADSQEEETQAQRDELSEYVTNNINTIKSAVTVNEVNKVAKAATLYLERRKTMESMQDIATRGITAIARDAEKRKDQLQEKTDATV